MKKALCIAAALLLVLLQAQACGEEAFRRANSIGNFSEGYAAFSDENGLWGYIDRTGSVVIEPQWDLADRFSGGVARIGVSRAGASGRLYGYINTAGEIVFPAVCSAATDFYEGLATVNVDGEYGFITPDGEYAFDGRWSDAGYFSDGMAYVRINGLYGFIDHTGAVVIAPAWDDVYSFSENRAAVEKDGLWGFIDNAGSVVIEPQYDTGERFSDGLAPVEKDGLSGYIAPDCSVVIPLQYDSTAYVYNNRAWVKRDGAYQMIDKTGAKIGESQWRNVFSDFGWADLCRVNQDGLWGYVNADNVLVLDAVYEKATRFSDGAAAVKKNGRWYLIDESGVDICSGENTQN